MELPVVMVGAIAILIIVAMIVIVVVAKVVVVHFNVPLLLEGRSRIRRDKYLSI